MFDFKDLRPGMLLALKSDLTFCEFMFGDETHPTIYPVLNSVNTGRIKVMILLQRGGVYQQNYWFCFYDGKICSYSMTKHDLELFDVYDYI